MNPEFLRRSAIGAMTAGTDAAYDIFAYGQGQDDKSQVRNVALIGGASGLGGNFAGQGLAHVLNLTDKAGGRAGVMGDILAAGSGISGSILGAIVGSRMSRPKPQMNAQQLPLDPYTTKVLYG